MIPRSATSSLVKSASSKPPESEDNATVSQKVYQELESQLLSGRLLPNTQLSLRTLAISLNTSMQPIRDAVSRLVGLSALKLAPGRSIRVPVLSRNDADDIWSMRLLLEGEAAARFAAQLPGDKATRLYDHTRALRQHRFGVDLEPTIQALMRWNMDLVRGSGSPLLIDIVSRLYLRYAPFLAQALSGGMPHDEGFLQFTLHIQDELILAIKRGDVVAARSLRCADLLSFQRYIYGRYGW